MSNNKTTSPRDIAIAFLADEYVSGWSPTGLGEVRLRLAQSGVIASRLLGKSRVAEWDRMARYVATERKVVVASPTAKNNWQRTANPSHDERFDSRIPGLRGTITRIRNHGRILSLDARQPDASYQEITRAAQIGLLQEVADRVLITSRTTDTELEEVTA